EREAALRAEAPQTDSETTVPTPVHSLRKPEAPEPESPEEGEQGPAHSLTKDDPSEGRGSYSFTKDDDRHPGQAPEPSDNEETAVLPQAPAPSDAEETAVIPQVPQPGAGDDEETTGFPRVSEGAAPARTRPPTACPRATSGTTRRARPATPATPPQARTSAPGRCPRSTRTPRARAPTGRRRLPSTTSPAWRTSFSARTTTGMRTTGVEGGGDGRPFLRGVVLGPG
ncbi:hypothetical protein SF12_18000, partial [Streptomyces sp. MBRL 601]